MISTAKSLNLKTRTTKTSIWMTKTTMEKIGMNWSARPRKVDSILHLLVSTYVLTVDTDTADDLKKKRRYEDDDDDDDDAPKKKKAKRSADLPSTGHSSSSKSKPSSSGSGGKKPAPSSSSSSSKPKPKPSSGGSGSGSSKLAGFKFKGK